MEPIETLAKNLKAEQSKLNKICYKTQRDEFIAQGANVTVIKQQIVDQYGMGVLTQVLIGKKRTDGKFKQLNSKGNGYGNL